MIKLDAEQKTRFLDELRESASVSRAARAIGVGPSVVTRTRGEDASFAAAWDEAIEEAWDERAAVYSDRGFKGWLEPVFHKGEVTGHIRKFSDRAASDTLKARLPELFGDRSEVNMRGALATGNLTMEERAVLIEKLLKTAADRKAAAEAEDDIA